MKVLIVHNYYSRRGGEDECFDAETRLLPSKGIDVVVHTQNSSSIAPSRRVSLALRTIWSREDYSAVRLLIRKERPDVMHVENFFPMISPAVYYASQAEGVPVVQSLHNYRLLCLSAELVRDGRVCEECLNRSVPLAGVIHNCYFRGRAASATLAGMLLTHRARRTFAEKVDYFTVPTDFARRKFIDSGFPEEKMLLRPTFVASDMGMGDGDGGYALFVGRLVPEKGLGVLLHAWDRLGKAFPLRIVGAGPLEEQAREAAQRIPGVEFPGRVSREQLRDYYRRAKVAIVPSTWYEGSPAVIGEAFSAGVPVIASDLGSMGGLIRHGRTGLHFRPGDGDDLAEKVRWAFGHPEELEEMRRAARREYEGAYTAEAGLRRQIEIYEMAARGRRLGNGI
jgi:glycosyltransferase involved in cell wall biosynthesis